MDFLSYLHSRVKLQTRLEQIRLEFTVTEIDTAWAFARSAETLYGAGSSNVDRVASKAWEAYGEAASRLRTLSVDHAQRDKLSGKLDEIRAILDALPRKSRAHSKNNKG